MWCWKYHIDLEFDKHLSSTDAKTPSGFQMKAQKYHNLK